GLVDAIAPRTKFDEESKNRALARAEASDRPTDAAGIELTELERAVEGDALRYPNLDVRLDRELGTAWFTLNGPSAKPVPGPAEAIVEAGAGFWGLAACRELDDAILHLRFNEPEIGTWVLQTKG